MAKRMKQIALITLLATIVFSIACGVLHNSVLLTLAITFGTIAYHFWMRLAVGGVMDYFMKNQADYSRPWFQQKAFEKVLYQKLKVKKWKGKMPTYDPEIFSLERHTYDEIVQAMCQAEVVHEIIVGLSFLPLLAAIPFGSFRVFLITSMVAAGMDMMFVIMQRYNRPRIVRLASREKKQASLIQKK